MDGIRIRFGAATLAVVAACGNGSPAATPDAGDLADVSPLPGSGRTAGDIPGSSGNSISGDGGGGGQAAGDAAPSLGQHAGDAAPPAPNAADAASSGPGTADAAREASANDASGPPVGGASGATVFLILMENHNWSDIKGSASAPYINGLLATGAHAEQYFNPPGIHPSEPNYLWLEAGTNFGVKDDNPPATNQQSSTQHLATLLNAAGISWRAYQEDISGTVCPLTATGMYAPKHDPFVFFDDITGGGSASDPGCIAHNRPYAELAADLTNDTAARYNFITPNLCDDMHDTCAPQNDSIKQGDDWLSQQIPKIQASRAYTNGAYVLITWDEAEGGIDGPIGMIALSKNAKAGYSGSVHYTHSSTLRSVQEIFGVRPFLGDAANATDLADLFTTFP